MRNEGANIQGSRPWLNPRLRGENDAFTSSPSQSVSSLDQVLRLAAQGQHAAVVHGVAVKVQQSSRSHLRSTGELLDQAGVTSFRDVGDGEQGHRALP